MNTSLLSFNTTLSKKNNTRKKRTPLSTVKAIYAMKECPVKITIQRQVNESGQSNNYQFFLFQGDIYHVADDI